MFSSCCKLALENDRFIEVYTTKNNEKRVDLREWKTDPYATKKGISLRLDLFKTFTLALDMIDTALNNNEDLHYHMGSNIFCSVQKDNPLWTYDNIGNPQILIYSCQQKRAMS